MGRSAWGALCASLVASLAGCGSDSAKAKFALQNGTGASALTTQSFGGAHLEDVVAAPQAEYFSMKMSNVSLLEDVDPVTQDDVGTSALIWVNPHCTSADDCDPFDFARPTGTVNAELNSQERDVPAGTYRYVRMELCYHGEKPAQPNVEWQTADMPAPRPIVTGMCAITSAEYDPPLVLQPGDSVSVALRYDLSQAVVEGAPGHLADSTGPTDGGAVVGFDDCVGHADGGETCFDIPRFVPVASVGSGGAGATVVAEADGGT